MLYAIVDKDGKVARHRSKGTLAVYQDTTLLKKHGWRYMENNKEYRIIELKKGNELGEIKR